MIEQTPMADALIASVLFEPQLIHNVALPDGALTGIQGQVFDTIRTLAQQDAPVNSISIQDALGTSPQLRTYLTRLYDMPTSSDVGQYVDAVIDVYERRQAEIAAQQLLQAAHNRDKPVAESKSEIAGKLLRGYSTYDTVSAADLHEEDLAEITEWAENPLEPGQVRGIPTNLHSLDMLLGGFWPGLFVFAGRTHMGKTALAVKIAREVAQSAPVLYCTFENTPKIVRRRMILTAAGIPYVKAKHGLNKVEYTRYVRVAEHISSLPIQFYDGERGLAYVTAVINKTYHKYGSLGMVALDNLGHIKTGEDKYEERGTVCKAMLALAGRLETTILALHQINRAPEARDDKRPRMSDLSDSGMIEQDADIIGLLYRHGHYHPECDNPNILDVYVAKNRLDGALGQAQLFFNRQTGDIANVYNTR